MLVDNSNLLFVKRGDTATDQAHNALDLVRLQAHTAVQLQVYRRLGRRAAAKKDTLLRHRQMDPGKTNGLNTTDGLRQ